MLFQVLYQSGYRRSLLSDGNIDAVDRLSCFVEALLVDDGVNSDSGLARLAVANDELALPTADGNHRVDSFQARLQGFLHGLSVDDAWRLAVEWHLESSAKVYVALSVDGLSQGVDDASQHVVVDTNAGNTACTLHHHALLNARSGTEQHTADVVLLQVHHDGHGTILELK